MRLLIGAARALLIALSPALPPAASLLGAQAASPAVIAGPAADRPLAWRLERAWSVGGVEDEELALTSIWAKDVATDGNGQLYVIDRTESRVVVYDRTGRRVRTIGRRGKGPGELSAALALDVAPDGTVHVDDVDKGGIVPFTPDGKPLSEYRLPRRVRGLRIAGARTIAGTRVERDSMHLAYGPPDSLRLLLSYPLAPTRSTPPVCRLTDYPAPPVFSATVTWAIRGGTMAAATDGFRITTYVNGTAQRVLTRATARRRSTPALARQHLGPGETMQILGERPCTIPAELILSVAEVAPELPAYAALAIAPDGRIWATRFTVRGEPGLADVFGARGYEGTIALGAVRPIGFLSTGELVSIERDADDVPVIAVYRVGGR